VRGVLTIRSTLALALTRAAGVISERFVPIPSAPATPGWRREHQHQHGHRRRQPAVHTDAAAMRLAI
jgi:hypothetical protein